MDYLALLLMEVAKFVGTNFDRKQIFTDHVMLENLAGGDMFYFTKGRWFVRNDSLPGDPVLKAIAFDKKTIFLETSPFNITKLAETLGSMEKEYLFIPASKTIADSHGRTLLKYTQSTTPEIDGHTLDKRMTITIPLEQTQFEGILLIDRLWSVNSFLSPDEDDIQTVTQVQKMELKLRMDLRLMLHLEQRPYLLLDQKLDNRQEMQLQGILSLQHSLLSLSSADLEQKIVELVTHRGEKEAIRVLDFILAGKVKKVRPTLTWRDARQIAKRMVSV